MISVTDMLGLSDSQLERHTADCGATDEDTHRLVLAVSNLRYCIGQSVHMLCEVLVCSVYKQSESFGSWGIK